ncbi:glycosyltransferase family 4 protein [Halomicrobium katesii]|uniref:glycosyltransferase family 4 protein n=1 Tax=Halomicrobium katesii TaxID=437163 RepID=UPI00036DC9B5|nr:glycosyltransferase family 4 protein [Halomicrobium katesii]
MVFKLAIFSSHPIQYKAPLYKRLAETGDIDVTVYYGSRHGIEETEMGFGTAQSWDIPLLEGYEHHFLDNYSWRDRPFGMFSLINLDLVRVIDDDIDAFWIHSGYYRFSSLIALVASRFNGVPVILHGTGHRSPLPPSREIAKRIYLRAVFQGVDAVLADCNKNRAQYEFYGVDPDSIYLAPCAVDNDRFQTARAELTDADVDDLRSELDIPDTHLVVLFVGKLNDRKRPMDLLEAFSRLPSSVDASLVFVGDGPNREALEAFCYREDVDDVRFAGFRGQTELPAFYELGDLFVLPSSYDPSPKVLNEAMNFELPIMASEGVGSAYDLVQDNGRLFEIGAVDEISEGLEHLLTDCDQLSMMGERSLEIVEQWDFDADVEAIRTALEAVT